jgi:hypothetical protein
MDSDQPGLSTHLSPDVRRDAVRLLDVDPPDNRLTTAEGVTRISSN